jgi:hypothetical protein
LNKTEQLDIILTMTSINGFSRENDFFRRIPQDKWEELTHAVEERGIRLSPEELKPFTEGSFDDPVFHNSDWPFHVFKAYRESRITQETLAKLLVYAMCQDGAGESGTVKHYQLLDSAGRVNEEARSVLQGRSFLAVPDLTRPGITKDLPEPEYRGGLGRFLAIENISNLPPQQTQFFTVESQTRGEDGMLLTLSANALKIGAHCIPDYKKGTVSNLQLVIPPDFLNHILSANFGANARLAQPVLGIFRTTERLSDPSQRVASLYFRDFVPPPHQIELIPCTALSSYHHDAMYHLFIDSMNPHRPRWIELARFFKEKGFPATAFLCLDGDFPSYYCTLDNKETDVEEFFCFAFFHFVLIEGLKKEKAEQEREGALRAWLTIAPPYQKSLLLLRISEIQEDDLQYASAQSIKNIMIAWEDSERKPPPKPAALRSESPPPTSRRVS